MEKINIAELLKDCPKGMELNCTSYNNVSFDKISDDKKAIYPIFCYITDEKGNRSSISFTEDGCESKRYGAKCVIFPKGKNTWEKFVPPYKFKDGDILATDLGSVFILNTHFNTNECYGCYTGVCCDGVFYINEPFAYKECCNFATEEEKEKLFNVIKENNYKWNPITKTLEKVRPKFKIGDKIVNDNYVVEITDIFTDDQVYGYKSKMGGIGGILFTEQDDWELVPDKFDVTTLKPFDKVLVRDSIFGKWKIEFFEKFDKELNYPFICMNGRYSLCIPYENNKHLHDTINPCDDYYKI